MLAKQARESRPHNTAVVDTLKTEPSLKHAQQALRAAFSHIQVNFASVISETSKSLIRSTNTMWEGVSNSIKNFDWAAINREVKAYSALKKYLDKAIADPAIKKSPGILSVVRELQHHLGRSQPGSDFEGVLQPILETSNKRDRSALAAKNASAKNIEGKAWVAKQWPGYRDKGWSKNRFAAWCKDEENSKVPQKIKVQLPSIDQIKRHWLKG